MKKMQTIKIFSIVLLMLGALAGCSEKKETDRDSRSEEELLVEHCRQIDTVSIRKVLNPDSILGAERLSAISADSWILIEEEHGLLIAAKDAEKKQYPASLTKMMTGKLVLEKGNPEDTVTITDDVFVVRDAMVRLGYSFLERDLLNEMLMQSDNDAAYALAKQVAGDTLAFCQMMNEKAAYLHMDSTHFANPNGMPNDSTFSSAYDLLVLARYCMSDSIFASIVGTKSERIPLIDRRYLDIENTNMLLKSDQDCLGIKTGYTRQAGGCLAAVVRREGITLYLVLLKSRSRSSRFDEAAQLFDYGFRVMDAYLFQTEHLVNP